nr:MAG TPA: hypothetical protein [Caudoviricetes sp.]
MEVGGSWKTHRGSVQRTDRVTEKRNEVKIRKE